MSVVDRLQNKAQFDPELAAYHHTIVLPDLSQKPLFANQFAYIIDAYKSVFTYVSENFSRLTGYDPNELTIPFWYSIVHPDDLPTVTRIGEALYHIGWRVLPHRKDFELSPWDFYTYAAYRIQKKDGDYIRIGRQTSILTKDRLGFPVHTIGVVSDLTGIAKGTTVVFHINLPDKSAMEKIIFRNNTSLSVREWEVARMLMKGYDSKIISEKLHVSFNTVNTHRRNMLRKMGVKNTTQLILKLTTEENIQGS